MIDNFDSFTYNLVHYIRDLGQSVEVARNNSLSIVDIERMSPKYIVISPGPCSPDEAGNSLEIIKRFAGKIPILGVCLGHQCIGQIFGATVKRAEQVMHGKTSLISHNDKTLFSGLANPLEVTRYHSLIIDPDTIPDELEVTAWTIPSENKNKEIMAIKHKHYAVEGVQFHPESVLTHQGQQLIKNFLERYN